MFARMYSMALAGIDAKIVEIEIDIYSGMPQFRIVGLPDKAVQESTDRVQSALTNSGFEFPKKRLIANLAPAELRKFGTHYDLPLALTILEAAEQLTPQVDPTRYLVMGELALDGSVRAACGALAAAIIAIQQNYLGLIFPADNYYECKDLAKRLQLIPVKSLREAVIFFQTSHIPELPESPQTEQNPINNLCFSDVRGQHTTKRALEIAAAGGHNVLMFGPPGTGKTMCAKRLPGIMPPLTFEESLETSRIHSVAGELPPGQGLLRQRPFRFPHHSASLGGLVGGGSHPRPGEVSLAHNGVLFLDEALQFPRTTLDILRQPLEDGIITISRVADTLQFPAQIMLVLSTNTCPCGNSGDSRKVCRCTPRQIESYRSRLTGPVLDRIDLHVEVPPLLDDAVYAPPTGEPSAEIRKRVTAARTIQKQRFKGRGSPINSAMTQKDVDTYCQLSSDCIDLLKKAMSVYGLSNRSVIRLCKVARTIADLAGVETISQVHLSEALFYRNLENKI